MLTKLNMSISTGSLGKLADPSQYHEPINILDADSSLLVRHLRAMLLIRYAEEKIADEYVAGNIKCPCHLGIGQEAVAVGVAASLRKSDRVFGAHRSHTHFLSLGGSVQQLFAEVLGKETGCSKGMGGSMHLHDKSIGFYGSVPIVGASVPIAVGAALAAKKDGRADIAVSYLGDSALEEGGVQEALNLASAHKLPILFVVENNLFASHLHISLRQPDNATIRFAEAHRIKSHLVDGNDVVAVQKAAEHLIQQAREKNEPGFLEAVTYRWRGHVGPHEDIDVGVKRKDDLSIWKKRDPINRLAAALDKANRLSSDDFLDLQEDVRREIEIAWLKASQEPYPHSSALLDLVYSSKTSTSIIDEKKEGLHSRSQRKMISYAEGILSGTQYLMQKYPEVFVFGQGLWSPWYVGASMTDLDKDFGLDRVIDSPVSEVAVTGAAVGASLCGYKPIVVHPRMDFMMLAVDQIVTQAAKWLHMFGGQSHPAVTIRGIINRGGEQGAQHSQALHAWFAHIPGLRVVMPATPQDARDLLVASVLSEDPVLYIDDRWLYELEEEVPLVSELDLSTQGPKVLRSGTDITLVGCGYSTLLSMQAASLLQADGISCEVVDLRVLNPLRYEVIIESLYKTKRLCSVDAGWSNCGIAGEVIAGVMERVEPCVLKNKPIRISLPDAPAPTSRALESDYYFTPQHISARIKAII